MFKYPLVALIGRTNVGKSTLFNRLTGKRTALVSEKAGTTRDVRFGECDWRGQKLMLADTAGLNVESIEAIDVESIKKAKEAIREADAVLLIVDGREGLLPEDREYAKMLRQSGKPVILVVNKIDSKKYFVNTDEFGNLGFKDMIGLSSRTGSGTGDLLDMILGKTAGFEPKDIIETDEESEKKEKEEISPLRISLIGRPNVGKSSLFNKIIGQERAIVSPVAHTTRESQDMEMLYESEGEKHQLIFVDTAGLVQHRKIKDKLKGMSIEQVHALLGSPSGHSVSGEYTNQYGPAMHKHGIIISYGLLAPDQVLPVVHFWRRATTVYFYSMYNHVMDPVQLARGKAMIYGGIATGQLRPIIDSVFPFERYLDAYSHMLSNTQRGKIVVQVRQ